MHTGIARGNNRAEHAVAIHHALRVIQAGLVVIPVGRLIEIIGEDDRPVTEAGGHLYLGDERLIIGQFIRAFIVELPGKSRHLRHIKNLERVEIPFVPQLFHMRWEGERADCSNAGHFGKTGIERVSRRPPLGRIHIQPRNAKARFTLHTPIASDDADHEFLAQRIKLAPVASVSGRTLRRNHQLEMAIGVQRQRVEIYLAEQWVMLASAQRIRPHLREDNHPHGAAIALDEIAATLFDQAAFVDGVSIGLEYILRDIEFGHEHRVAAIPDHRVRTGPRKTSEQHPHRFRHHLSITAQPLRHTRAHGISERPQAVDQLFPCQSIICHQSISALPTGPVFAPPCRSQPFPR